MGKMESKVSIEELLHARITKHCLRLYMDGHFKHAASDAMTQVEQALKEKSGLTSMYGSHLVDKILGKSSSIKLVIPLSPELQDKAHKLFHSAFGYYRNYAVHDGTQIDDKICLRIMILASELLDLINASEVSFADIGGVKGLITNGLFSNENEIIEILTFLSDLNYPVDAMDGLSEELAEKGFKDRQMQAVIETGLIECKYEDFVIPSSMNGLYEGETETVASFCLTLVGEQVLNDLRK